MTKRVCGRKRGRSEKTITNWTYFGTKGRGREKLENDEQRIMRERDTAALEESGAIGEKGILGRK